MPDNVLVGIPEIAELAGVSRSAVSNWRKRYNDFPEPRVQTESGVLFDIGSVEEWLLARGKLDGPFAPGALVWRFADALRGNWSSDQYASFLGSWVVYLEACDRAARAESAEDLPEQVAVAIPREHRWEAVQHARDPDLPAQLRRAARGIERHNPPLEGLLSGLTPDPFPQPDLVRAFVAHLEGAAATDGSRIGLYEEAQRRVHSLDRFSGEFDTPDDVAYLMSRLAGAITGAGTVVDPAVGTGGLLLMWAVSETRPHGPVDLLGVEANKGVARHARALFFIHGVEADIRCADALRLDEAEWPQADVVLLDPPMGLGGWGDAALYRDKRWVFGTPPARNADLAWVQLCVSMLKPTGRAVVSLPAGSLTSGGVEAEIRQTLIDWGVIEAVIELPARLRRNTSIPIALWLLRPPDREGSEKEVLLVDASRLGSSGRSEHELGQQDIERVVELVEQWRQGVDVGHRLEEPESDLVDVMLEPWDIVDANLSPRRYWSVPRPDLSSLRESAEELRWELHSAAASLREAVTSLLDHDPPLPLDETAKCAHGLSRPTWCPDCREERRRAGSTLEEIDDAELEQLLAAQANRPVSVRAPREKTFGSIPLGAIAHVISPTGGSAAPTVNWHDGDIAVRATAGGFVVNAADDAGPERVTGRVVLIRPRSDQSIVTPEWLRLWTASNEFRDLLDQHAKGTAVRSVPASDLVRFQVPVPSADGQRAAAELVARVDAAASCAAAVAQTITSLRDVEVDRALAEATEAPA